MTKEKHSKYRGVTFDEHQGAYVAQIAIAGKIYRLGRFKNDEDGEIEAARMVDNARISLMHFFPRCPDFRKLNFDDKEYPGIDPVVEALEQKLIKANVPQYSHFEHDAETTEQTRVRLQNERKQVESERKKQTEIIANIDKSLALLEQPTPQPPAADQAT